MPMDGRFASEVVLAVVPPAVMVQGVGVASAAAAGQRNVIDREFMATSKAWLTAICTSGRSSCGAREFDTCPR